MNMGYAVCFSNCIGCGRMFGFNPLRVPSLPVNGVREPVCRDCIETANVKRSELGLDLHVIRPDAYEPIDERELP